MVGPLVDRSDRADNFAGSGGSVYPLDGLWAHGAGDHVTRPTPACAQRKG